GVERRAGVDDPEADQLAGLRRERMRDVLAGVAVEGHPVGGPGVRLVHVELRRLAEAVRAQVPLAGDDDVVPVGPRQHAGPRLDDRRPRTARPRWTSN